MACSTVVVNGSPCKLFLRKVGDVAKKRSVTIKCHMFRLENIEDDTIWYDIYYVYNNEITADEITQDIIRELFPIIGAFQLQSQTRYYYDTLLRKCTTAYKERFC